MSSSINFIGTNYYSNRDERSPDVARWDCNKGFKENLLAFRLDEQLRWFLDQTIAIAYFMDFYGPRCHELVNEYANELWLDFNTRFVPLANREYKTGPFLEILKTITRLQKYARTKILEKDPDIDLIKEFLDGKSEGTEMKWAFIESTKHTYIPYLIWISKNPTMTEYTEKNLGLLTFNYRANEWKSNTLDGYLIPRSYSIGPSFYAAKSPIDHKIKHIPVLSYLSQFNLSATRFESLVGAIGEMCFHTDVRRSGTSNSQKLAAAIRAEVLGLGDLSGCHPGIECDTDEARCDFFYALKDFLDYANKTYGTKATSNYVVAKIFSCVAHGKLQKESADYIRDQGGSASADKLESFKQTLGSLEALQFISQSPTLLSAQSQVTEPKAEDSGDAKKEKSEPEKKDDPKKETKEGKPEEDDTNQDKPTKDDTSDDEDTKKEGSETEETGDDGQASTSGEETGSDAVDMPVDEDPPPNTSDDKGFEIKVSNPENETTDSVMFREELNTLLKNILANPPADMSPQNVETLVALQRYWLHTLSIETILGIVGSCNLQLPESLTKLTTQCTE